MRWMSRWTRTIGHNGATTNARVVLERHRWELEQVAALARRIQRADAERTAAARAAAERTA